MDKHHIGIIGLGVMGHNLAQNVERNGFSVAGYDLDAGKVEQMKLLVKGKKISVTHELSEFLSMLERPRRILIMVTAGKPVDAVIENLKPQLDRDDILIDGGNSFFKDTIRRGQDLEKAGIRFIGAGISGGEEGALWGPSIMPGGQESAYKLVESILTKISAQTEDGPCCTYIGPGGAGHFVKMVHNAIEYGDMELICESYGLLHTGLGLSNEEIGDIFKKWNQGELNSYLMEISAEIVCKKDSETGKYVIDLILDQAEQKGTGKWSAQVALDLGVAVPTLTAAVEARILSAFKQERIRAAKILTGPSGNFKGDRRALIEDMEKALLMAKILCYAQGFGMMRVASEEYGFKLQYAEIARIWKGGCIIRARLLDRIKRTFLESPDLPNLLVADAFSKEMQQTQNHLRRIVQIATQLGIPCLAMSTALAYFDSYRTERLPANLLQAQRDYFGAHTYKRIDRKGTFHTNWNE